MDIVLKEVIESQTKMTCYINTFGLVRMIQLPYCIIFISCSLFNTIYLVTLLPILIKYFSNF